MVPKAMLERVVHTDPSEINFLAGRHDASPTLWLVLPMHFAWLNAARSAAAATNFSFGRRECLRDAAHQSYQLRVSWRNSEAPLSVRVQI